MSWKFPPVTVEPVVFLGMLAFSLNMVAMPQMILHNVCLKKHNETKCAAMYTGSFKKEYDTVQEISTLWIGALLVGMALVTALFLPFMAALSDEFGRRKMMSLSPLSQLFQSIVIALILSTGLAFPTWLMVLAALLSCLVGDFGGLYVFTYSYIADITSEKTITLRINILESAAILAGFVATLSSGYIIERFGYIGIYIACILTDIVGLLYIIFVLKPVDRGSIENNQKETYTDWKMEGKEKKKNNEADLVIERLQEHCCENKVEKAKEEENTSEKRKANDEKERNEAICVIKNKEFQHQVGSGRTSHLRSPVNDQVDNLRRTGLFGRLCILLKRSNPVSNIKRVLWILKFHSQLKNGLVLFFLMVCGAATYSGELAVIVLFLKNRPFYMDPVHIGYFLAFKSAGLAILGLIGINYLLTRCLKLDDYTILLLTASAYTVYCVLLGFATSTLMLYLIQAMNAISTLYVSTIRAMISKLAPPSAAGLLFSAILIVEALSILIGSMVAPLVYYAVVSTHPGSVFFITASFMFTSACFSLRLFLKKRIKNQNRPEEKERDAQFQFNN